MVLKHSAAGDLLMLRCLPVKGRYDGYDVVREYLQRGEFCFANLEATVHRYECPPSQESGGSWVCTSPDVLADVKDFGFNMISLANNHSLDFSFEGVVKTMDYVRQAGLPAAGTGNTLAEAAAPVYLDCQSGRYALIAATSSFSTYAMAGEQSASMMGRPGVNGIRFEESFHIRQDQMDMLKALARETAINAYADIVRAEGYRPAIPENQFEFGSIRFELDDQVRRVTKVKEEDMKRIEKAIFEAQLQADSIIVSLHAHEISGTSKEAPDLFIQEFAHRCIDAGAHAVVGHGPHLLRPLEIYKGRPIFYSLGDFILHNENIRLGPAQWYNQYKVSPDATMHELFKTRSANFTRGLQTDHKMFEAIIPYWEMENGELTKLQLMPVELNFGLPRSVNGWPRFDSGKGILERLAAMSESFGTRITIKDGLGEVTL